MPSRSNPNVPTASKAKSARTIKTKRQKSQRLARGKANHTAAPRTSQAIRKAAATQQPSKKKARKLEKLMGHARKRALEEALAAGEVEMKDADDVKGTKRGSRRVGEDTGMRDGSPLGEEVVDDEMAVDVEEGVD